MDFGFEGMEKGIEVRRGESGGVEIKESGNALRKAFKPREEETLRGQRRTQKLQRESGERSLSSER